LIVQIKIILELKKAQIRKLIRIRRKRTGIDECRYREKST